MQRDNDNGRIASGAQEAGAQAEQAGEAVRQGAEELARATQQIEQTIEAAGQAAEAAFHAVGEQIAAGARATDRAVRNHPYQAAGIALIAGLLVGYLLKRK